MDGRKREIREELNRTRSRTLWLLEQVPEEFLRRRVHSFYSPIGWHFGHVGRTEEYWVVGEALKKPLLDNHLSWLFADLPDNPKDNRTNIPDRAGICEYLARTRARVLDALDDCTLDCDDPYLQDGYALEFAIQHECQHQETIAEMLCLIHRGLVRENPPDELPGSPFEWKQGIVPDWVKLPAGTFCMGSDDVHGYDNEKAAHMERVETFELGKYPVTSIQWSEFMRDGGYEKAELWSAEGWAWRGAEAAEMPEYWVRIGDEWGMIGPQGVRAIHPDEPAGCISWFEAEAFAKWSGARLPTEVEWEYAAAGPQGRWFPWGGEWPDDSRADFGLNSWGPRQVDAHPQGATADGVHGLAGGLWEWTASAFLPYPGFQAFPYDGYSKDHMKGAHRVCRGGSFATSPGILRCSFRNWYVPTYRQGFLGMRLAR